MRVPWQASSLLSQCLGVVHPQNPKAEQQHVCYPAFSPVGNAGATVGQVDRWDVVQEHVYITMIARVYGDGVQATGEQVTRLIDDE